MSQTLSPQTHDTHTVERPPRPAIPRGATLASLAVLFCFIATQARSLYQEWRVLRVELTEVRKSVVIGYPGIQQRISYAQRPADWYRVEPQATHLWSGWSQGIGHRWFVTSPGDIPRDLVSLPVGRDVNQAIDRPIVEFQGGSIWGRIPDDAHVAGEELGGVETAYPLLVLERVIVVNDQIRDQPFLVTFNPLEPTESKVAVYDPLVEGQRVIMGMSGYFHQNTPMLYDRETESLWIRDGEVLKALTGKLKGRKLPQVSRPSSASWKRWRTEHPKGRLVVGADRGQTSI